jgi:hypothetical protein
MPADTHLADVLIFLVIGLMVVLIMAGRLRIETA